MRCALTISALLLTTWLTPGCAELEYDNKAAVFDRPYEPINDSLGNIWLKTCYLYPVRDYLIFSWAGRALAGDEAWDVGPDGQVADGPFFVNRDIRGIPGDQLRVGPPAAAPPAGPWQVKKAKEKGATPGFIGEDAGGRTFLVKLDDPAYPELGTSAEMIGSRIYWLMGYRVPTTYLTRIDGTGDARYDGKRATASAFVPGKAVGEFKFDCYRMRREVRALRLVAAWLNDTDRTDNNTLVAVEDGRAFCYLVDFNSCLGSWNGHPKEAWRGWRYTWDVEYQLLGAATLGLLPALPRTVPVKSPAVGSFELLTEGNARAWRSQNPNTAFDRMTQADAEWMARRMAAVTIDQLRAVVASAEFTDPVDGEAVLEMLQRRRERLLEAWRRGGLLEDVAGG
ncbi:MAG TPA: hypothetical protein VMV94_16030 [Phycisphaerae bacterium]|nr:hypothetical protein [Phycisphaerae bacterium]